MASVDKDLESGGAALGGLDFEKAHKHFAKAAKADPKNAEAFFGKAESALGLPKADAEDILASYGKAVELDPRNPQYLEALGLYCLDTGRFTEAEKAFNDAAEADPEEAPMYWAQFAIQYARKAPAAMEAKGLTLDDQTLGIIRKKALGYALKALDIPEGEAPKLL